MALENVHPVFLERLKKQLPQGYSVLRAESESESAAVFFVEKDGQTQKAKMNKGNLLQVMVRRAPEVSAREGDPLNLVIQELADAYDLHLLDKVDYDVEGAVVEFGSKAQYQVSVPMLESSISLTGVLIFTVKNKDAPERSKECIAVDLEEQRVRLALAGKIFEAADAPEERVPDDLAEKASTFVNSLGFKMSLSAEDFAEAEVVCQLKDGISNLLILQFVDGLVAPVRWK